MCKIHIEIQYHTGLVCNEMEFMRRTANIPNILFIVLSNYTELCAEKMNMNHIRVAQGLFCELLLSLHVLILYRICLWAICFVIVLWTIFRVIGHALIQLALS